MKKSYLSLLLGSILISGAAVVIVLYRLSPYDETWWLSLGLFFLSSFICLASIFALIGSLVRLAVHRQETYFVHFMISLRQGILLSLFCLAFLGFSIVKVVTWWNIVLLFVAFLLVELYFINRHSSL